MKPSILLLIMIFTATTVWLPALSVEELQVSYQAAVLKTNESRDKQIGTLNQRYSAALTKLQEQVQKKGDLETAVAIKNEGTLIAENTWPLPPVPKVVSKTLTRPRQTYLKTRVGIERDWALSLSKLAEKMEAALEGQITSLTKDGKLEEAQSAKELLGKIRKDPEISKARELPERLTESGRARAGYLVRRAGDDIEVLVRYDSEGNISLKSPIENVVEKTGGKKEKGKTTARTLGEFVGAEGYQQETIILFDQDLEKGKLEFSDSAGVAVKSKVGVAGKTGMEFKIVEKATNAYCGIEAGLPSLTAPGTFRVEVEYFVPADNRSIAGIHLRHGNSKGSLIGSTLKNLGEWSTTSVSAKSGYKGGLLRIHFSGLNLGKMKDAWGDKIYLRRLTVSQSRFSAMIVESYGKSGDLVKSNLKALAQVPLVTNGSFAQ